MGLVPLRAALKGPASTGSLPPRQPHAISGAAASLGHEQGMAALEQDPKGAAGMSACWLPGTAAPATEAAEVPRSG